MQPSIYPAQQIKTIMLGLGRSGLGLGRSGVMVAALLYRIDCFRQYPPTGARR